MVGDGAAEDFLLGNFGDEAAETAEDNLLDFVDFFIGKDGGLIMAGGEKED